MSIINTTVERLVNACVLHKCDDGHYRASAGFVLWLQEGGTVETITSIEVTDTHTTVNFEGGGAQYPKHVIPVRLFTEVDLHEDDL